jgi:hypothetical protein
VLQEDHDDLLYHLIHCGREHENGFYRLPEQAAIHENSHYWKESEQTVELLAMVRNLGDSAVVAMRANSRLVPQGKPPAHYRLSLA